MEYFKVYTIMCLITEPTDIKKTDERLGKFNEKGEHLKIKTFYNEKKALSYLKRKRNTNQKLYYIIYSEYDNAGCLSESYIMEYAKNKRRI